VVKVLWYGENLIPAWPRTAADEGGRHAANNLDQEPKPYTSAETVSAISLCSAAACDPAGEFGISHSPLPTDREGRSPAGSWVMPNG